jgi:hypothetical protein
MIIELADYQAAIMLADSHHTSFLNKQDFPLLP